MSTVVRNAGVQKLMSAFPASTAASHQGPKQRTDSSESRIVRLAQEGDADAFERMYRIHSHRVYALCLRMTRNPALAEDLTQDVFLQVFRKIHTFRGESAFSTWLYRLAFNVVLMRLRIKTLKETTLEARTEKDGDTLPPRELGMPDLRIAGVPDRLDLNRALKQLPPGYRLIFLLHDVQEYEHHEIAEALGFSVGNSKSQLHKARIRLRMILGGRSRSAHGNPSDRGA
jgi:RNA polymerase sigma-70 factor, ECF subfamily